jgi:hypothetical protein
MVAYAATQPLEWCKYSTISRRRDCSPRSLWTATPPIAESRRRSVAMSLASVDQVRNSSTAAVSSGCIRIKEMTQWGTPLGSHLAGRRTWGRRGVQQLSE